MRDAAGGWVPDVSLTKREAFDFLDCFLPAICGYSTLTFHPGAMLTLRDAAGWWVPNVSLTIQETLDILIIFYPWYCIYLTLFSIQSIKQRCWLMGPRGQPLSTRKPAQKRTLERRFEHKTSISETWLQRCLATAPTSWVFTNVTNCILIYFQLPIPSVINSCSWWVP